MEHEQLLVWLEVLPEGPPTMQNGVICRRHADAMVVPRGWTLDDRREARPRLFKVVDTGRGNSTQEMRRPRTQKPVTIEPAPQLVFESVEPSTELIEEPADDITVGEIRPLGEHDPEETQALPWRPVFDDSDDLGGLLTAKSPLLARAFRGASADSGS